MEPVSRLGIHIASTAVTPPFRATTTPESESTRATTVSTTAHLKCVVSGGCVLEQPLAGANALNRSESPT